MGTRSTYLVTRKRGEDKKPIMLLYFQFDGYPSGHPVEVAEWLSQGKVVNGIGMDRPALVFNGAGCLAAQLVAKYKTDVGGQYLYPIDSRGECWEDYLYEIIVDDEELTIEFVCQVNGEKELFRGLPGDFVTKVNNNELE